MYILWDYMKEKYVGKKKYIYTVYCKKYGKNY